jgi:hypothetical protein
VHRVLLVVSKNPCQEIGKLHLVKDDSVIDKHPVIDKKMRISSELLMLKSGLQGTRFQTFKLLPLTQYADISVLDSYPLLEISS